MRSRRSCAGTWRTASTCSGSRRTRSRSDPTPVNTVRWWEEFAARLEELGALMDGMAISTHPGQYTVLGSVRPEVVDASLAELEYQALLLRSFGLDTSHKLVIHLSGTAGRFLAGVERLSDDARARLVVENDERWSLEDV